MKLPRNDTNRAMAIIEQEDTRNFKKGQDIQLGQERIILRAPDGGAWALVVDNSGALSTVAA